MLAGEAVSHKTNSNQSVFRDQIAESDRSLNSPVHPTAERPFQPTFPMRFLSGTPRIFGRSPTKRAHLYRQMGPAGMLFMALSERLCRRPRMTVPAETRLRQILSGEARDPAATVIRPLLALAAPFYAAAVGLRNLAWDRAWFRAHAAPIPVVSLGNLTTGGTGKTPLAAFLARWFRDRGVRVCFLSRGYRSGESAFNDEALVLERLCPDVPHLQNPDRVAAAATAREELFSQLLLLDDGFQHRRLKRDLDIVLVDATNPWGYGHLLPRGLLREPRSSLRRAGLIVITRVDLVPAGELERLRSEIGRLAPDVRRVEVAFVTDQFVNWSGTEAEAFSGRVGALSAIGNPDSFVESLRRTGIDVTTRRDYPDHHRYTRDDLRAIGEWATGAHLDAIATTRKDLVKLQVDEIAGVPLWSVDQRVEVRAGLDRLEAALSPMLGRIPPDPDDPTDGPCDHPEPEVDEAHSDDAR